MSSPSSPPPPPPPPPPPLMLAVVAVLFPPLLAALLLVFPSSSPAPSPIVPSAPTTLRTAPPRVPEASVSGGVFPPPWATLSDGGFFLPFASAFSSSPVAYLSSTAARRRFPSTYPPAPAAAATSSPLRPQPTSAKRTASPMRRMAKAAEDAAPPFPRLTVGRKVGSGSYGTVHECTLTTSTTSSVVKCIAKRPWTFEELRDGAVPPVSARPSMAINSNGGQALNDDASTAAENEEGLRGRAERCRHYWEVERHCFRKIADAEQQGRDDDDSYSFVPTFLGSYRDDGSEGGDGDEDGGRRCEWMVFEMVGGSGSDVDDPALTLLDAIELDWKDQHSSPGRHHHLYDVQTAMNLPSEYEFGDVLDAVFESLLDCVAAVHSCNIVHRDVKPGNLLCDGKHRKLRLIDFGSAADMDPSPFDANTVGDGGGGKNLLGRFLSGGTTRVGFDGGLVALSPVYAAPESFVQLDRNPLSFDVYSSALVFCQLLFNLLDERTDAGFHQRLADESVGHDLDLWLESELTAKLRPAGFEDALTYLAERPGTWALLKEMFRSDPARRIGSSDASERFRTVLEGARRDDSGEEAEEGPEEEAYLRSVVASSESCLVDFSIRESSSYEIEGSAVTNTEVGMGAKATSTPAMHQRRPRPLHFVATFKSGVSLGLVLAETGDDDDLDGMTEDERARWERATKYAYPGEVFVKGWSPGGQADRLGIFEIGDRLRAVGEIPVVDCGFEQVVELIGRQPRSARTVRMHLDRRKKPRMYEAAESSSSSEGDLLLRARVTGQGAWKTKGRRSTQEDAFVLHEIGGDDGDVILVGVFDGHGGTAASESASKLMPSLFGLELAAVASSDGPPAAGGPSSSAAPTADKISAALERSWEITCDTYRGGCEINGEGCAADYDPVEGVLFAETGSKDLIAGTTATMVAMSLNGASTMTVLNCGDSRTLVVGRPKDSSKLEYLPQTSVVQFCTRDHSPDDEIEIERLQVGRDKGLDFSLPECSSGSTGSWLGIGDYQYALCRSLEGTYVTSKGIVSYPDVTTLNLASLLSENSSCAVVLACDGLFEVMSNEEVGREVINMRDAGYSPGEIAKNLCGHALKKGSYDNVSVVVFYLDELK